MKYIKKIIKKIKKLLLKELHVDIENQSLAMGRLLIHQIKNYETICDLRDVEFKIFSQWGEDGIIQYLIHKLPIKNKVFVEFGIENYEESNTRFLLMNDNWSGLVIDGSCNAIQELKNKPLYWKYDIIAKNHFITKDNINNIILDYIKENKFYPDIGLLSIDLDGIDYYVLESIECIDPSIIVCEYNWIFGNKAEVTVPYDEKFDRTKAHHSNLYWGASLPAIYKKAKEKGYEYIGCTSAGNDAFFVKSELAKAYLRHLITDPDHYFVEQKTKESRNKDGSLSYIRGDARKHLIKDKILLDLKTNQLVEFKNIID